MAHVDVIVIGGGIAGASAAAALAERHSVLLVERETQPGYHSTGRSAALFSEIYGSAPVRALSRASRTFFFEPPQGFADGALVRPRGALFIADRQQLGALEDLATQADVAKSGALIDAAAARAHCPILRDDHVAGGFFENHSCDVEVHSLHQGFLRRLKARGGRVLLGSGVAAIELRGAGWRIRAGDDLIFASLVVNAAGAWADEVAQMAGVRPIGVQPLRRTAMLVAPPDGVQVGSWPAVFDVEDQWYFKPDAGQLLLSPADETPSAPCDAQPDEMDIAVGVDRVERATTLVVKRVTHRWAGLRTFVADHAPVIGFDPECPGFFWLAGQGGYGIQTAPAVAQLTADLIETGEVSEVLARHGVASGDLGPRRLRCRETI